MKEKRELGVALVHKLCPICCKKVEEEILINSKLSTKYAEKVEELNGKAIGFSDNTCEKCSKYKDECVYIISIDPEKSDMKTIGDIYRMGHISGVKNNSDFIKSIPENYILKTANGVRYAFMDYKEGVELGLFKKIS